MVIDVSVKEYAMYRDQNMQEGYGFLTLASYDDAMRVASAVQNVCFEGVTLTCQLTHQHNPSSKKNKGFNVGMSMAQVAPGLMTSAPSMYAAPVPQAYSSYMSLDQTMPMTLPPRPAGPPAYGLVSGFPPAPPTSSPGMTHYSPFSTGSNNSINFSNRDTLSVASGSSFGVF